MTPQRLILRREFDRLNREVFDGVLIRIPVLWAFPTEAEESPGMHTFGLFYEPTYRLSARIIITARNKTRHQAFETLAHEMVHLWQYMHKEPLDHGPGFEQWRNPIMEATGYDI